MMLKKKVKNLQEYYYQWMCKHKDDADRRLALLREVELDMTYCAICKKEIVRAVSGLYVLPHADGCELAEDLK